MRGAFGPVLTTGVALAAAAVVVANPVMPSRADVQIPAVQLSAGASDALGMLDEEFLKAIAPAPPVSNNPFVIIRDLISSLAADATYLGTNAIVEAFVAGATAVTQPELTASSSPYILGDPRVLEEQAPADPFWVPFSAFGDAMMTQVELPPPLLVQTVGTNDFAPVMAQVVTAVITDVNYVGNQIVTAAFAAGAMLAAEPGLIIDTLRALIDGDVRRALENAVKVVVAPLGPPRIILDAIRTVIQNRLPPLPAVTVPVTGPPVSVESPRFGATLLANAAGNDAPNPDAPDSDVPDSGAPNSDRRVGTKHPRVAPVESPVIAPRPAAAVGSQSDVAGETTGAAVVPGGAIVPGDQIGDDVSAKPAPRPGRAGTVGDAVREVRDAARTGLRDASDTVRKATDRATKAAGGPSAD